MVVLRAAKKSGRNNEVTVLQMWPKGGVPLYIDMLAVTGHNRRNKMLTPIPLECRALSKEKKPEATKDETLDQIKRNGCTRKP